MVQNQTHPIASYPEINLVKFYSSDVNFMSYPECPITPQAMRRNGSRERQTHAKRVAPVAQAVLQNPHQAHSHILELYKSPDSKTHLDPLFSVLSQLVLERMVGDLTQGQIESSSTDKPVLGTLSARVLDLYRHSTFYPNNDSHNAFVAAQMHMIDPYFESVVGEMINDKNNPYHPVWREFSNQYSKYVDTTTDPILLKYHKEYEHSNPVSGLYTFFWEASGTFPLFGENVAERIYTPDITSIGQFQQQCLKQGVVGLFARGAEMAKNARNTRIVNGNLPVDQYHQDSSDGIIVYTNGLQKGINAGISRCPGAYGLLSPSDEVQEMNKRHNETVGIMNRGGVLLTASDENIDPNLVVSPAEVLAYSALLVAPSTIWRHFLESEKITDWSDALPGTRTPDGKIIRGGKTV